MYMEPTLYPPTLSPSFPAAHARAGPSRDARVPARTCMRNYARGGEIMYVPDLENRYQWQGGGGKGCEVASRTFLLRLPAASTWPLLGTLRLESVYLDGDAAAPGHFKTIITLVMIFAAGDDEAGAIVRLVTRSWN